jgi:hypothetical protein
LVECRDLADGRYGLDHGAGAAVAGAHPPQHAGGVSTATVARIERDEIEPRMTTLGKLADALNVDPAELVED